MTIQDKVDLTLWLAFANLFLMVVLALWFVYREIRHDPWEDGYEEGRADYAGMDQYSRLDKADGLKDNSFSIASCSVCGTAIDTGTRCDKHPIIRGRY